MMTRRTTSLRIIALTTALLACCSMLLPAQELKWYFSADSTAWVKVNALAQVWLRYDQSNPGTLVNDQLFNSTVDIGIRRGRIQALAHLNDRTALYMQYGLNNFNSAYAIGSNRKNAAFFHDIFAEYRVTTHNELTLGGGLTIANGLSRFSQPSVATIMTMDVPVFAQATVDQTDEFSRKLSVTARGQIGPIDYRFSLSDPFPITSNGAAAVPISPNATFAREGHTLQGQTYLMWQFRDHEPHATPYMTGTYLGTKNVFNIAFGAIHQPKAMWRTTSAGDTIFDNMTLIALESFYDAPISSDGAALSAYIGGFHYDYGTNYLRYNGIMNPATGQSADVTPKPLSNVGPTYGNAFPMFGTGNALYTQWGVYFPKVIDATGLMPYVSAFAARWQLLDRWTTVFNVGCSVLLDGHRSKLTLDLQNRPTYGTNTAGDIVSGGRKTQVVLQWQAAL